MNKNKFDDILKASIFEPEKMKMIKYKGILDLDRHKIPCYVDKEGNRLLSSREMQRALKIVDKGGPQKPGKRLERFLKSTKLTGLREELGNKKMDPLIRYDGGKKINGYKAEVLVDICDYMLHLRKNKELDSKKHTRLIIIADQCEILLRSFAKIGIISLIDEATGFIKDIKKNEYKELFLKFLRDEAKKYASEFPIDLYESFYKMYDLPQLKKNHPSFFGHLTNRFIYYPLAKSNGFILEGLKEKNPVISKGYGANYRKYHHHQFLEAIGIDSLKAHIWQIIGIIKASSYRKKKFEREFEKHFGKDYQLNFEDYEESKEN